MDTRVGIRAVFLLVLLLSGGIVAAGYASADRGTRGLDAASVGDRVAPPSSGTTVIATDSNTWLGREGSGPRASAQLVAIGPDGRVRYLNDSHTRYWDVDPVNGTNATVEYLYADHLTPEECGGEEVCTRNGIERVNLTTGEVEQVFSRVTPGKHSTRWHDADRIDANHVVVGDIAQDRVFVVNTSSNIVEWEWNAQSAFSTAESGGPYPEDWTHLNDVEVLDDGRIMASIRNQDQVVFLDRDTGVVKNWTLGRDGAHDVLYEQHNPDYIPESRGGPSVLVADSENDRVVEYRRSDGEWSRTWLWRDDRLKWPRDADRLPNGHTLITDSNGNRVFEVDEQGEIVWQYDVAFPYEAERLGTGDESTGGPASGRAGLDSRTTSAGESGEAQSGVSGPLGVLTGFSLPNEIAYVLPVWMDHAELLALVCLVLTALVWVAAELRWAGVDATVRTPIRLRWDR